MSGNKKFPRTHTGRLAADMVLRYYTHDVARDSAALDAMSPLKVLGRGYAMARTEEGGILRSSAQVRPGDRIELRLAQGSLGCRVEEVEGEETHGKENL